MRTRRDAKGFSFLEVNDGTCLRNIQVIVDEAAGFTTLKDVNTGAAVKVAGRLVDSPGKGQKWEIHASELRLMGHADPKRIPSEKTSLR